MDRMTPVDPRVICGPTAFENSFMIFILQVDNLSDNSSELSCKNFNFITVCRKKGISRDDALISDNSDDYVRGVSIIWIQIFHSFYGSSFS